MDLFSFIALAGGLALFLYGMGVMSAGLERMAGGKLEKILKSITASPFKGLLTGFGITAAIQSSSAVTVMLVGLVNSGIMAFEQTVYIIMGSNIGTTMTAWLLSLAGLTGSNIFVKLLKPTSFAPILAMAGVMLMMISRKERKKDAGQIMIGFAVLMYGMSMMSDAVSPLADMPEFTALMTAFTNPFLGVLAGIAITAVIQSSSASVGILQALSLTGAVTGGIAIPIIMGQNIGTCVTSLISSIGASKNARRVSVIHISFNIIGTALCLTIYLLADALIGIPFFDEAITPAGIAIAHTVFNIVNTVVLLPFGKQLAKLAAIVIPGDSAAAKDTLIDERLLNTPSFALSECALKTRDMATLAQQVVMKALPLTSAYNQKTADFIPAAEDKLDGYEDGLGTCLVKISSKSLSEEDSRTAAQLLHTIGELERIGDHALNISQAAKEVFDKKIIFSDDAKRELETLCSAISEILDITIRAFIYSDEGLASDVEPLEQVIDSLIAQIKANHIKRLQNGRCTIEHGFVLSDILSNCERISDHCSNIAVAVIEVPRNSFDTHEYLGKLKEGGDEAFDGKFKEYKNKYAV